MARVATTNLGLGTWAQGENPGAGPQGSDSNGLNGNAYKLDVAVGTEHTTAGAHKDAVIDKNNLKTTVCDGSTIEKDSSAGLRIKDLGVTKGKLSTDVADASTIEKDASVGLRIKANGVTGAKLKQTGTGAVVDETTLEFSSDEMRIKDDGVTAAKISHDNNRTKVCFTFSILTDAAQYAYSNGLQCTASLGVPMPQAGSITKVSACNSSGAVSSQTAAYGAQTFSAGDKMQVYMDQSAADTVQVRINDTTKLSVERSGSAWMVTVEVEFDDA